MTEHTQKPLSKEIEKIVNNNFQVDTSNDEELLNLHDYSWDDLHRLKNELGNSILQFIEQVHVVITSPGIINNLGKHKDHFNKLVSIFFSDINEFSNKVKAIRLQHDEKTGKLTDLNEFNVYNRLTIQYHALFTELTTLITPTLSDLILTIAEINQEIRDKINNVEDAVLVSAEEKNNG